MQKTKTLAAIDRNLEHRQGKGFRRHLGASIIGRLCARQIWYTFRWARAAAFKARILRLFDRGNLEEERFVRWLRNAGVHVLDRDPETNLQFRVEAHDGHFGGSLDGKLFDTPDFPMQWVLGEFKTHNNKSYNEVVKKGVKAAKIEHWAQMQVYLHLAELEEALYFAVNKDNDDLHVEIVHYEREYAEALIDLAGRIIYAEGPPPRISESPAWYYCKFCDFNRICHDGHPKAVNCRTCKHSRPIEGGRWKCTRYDYILSHNEQLQGCQDYSPILED